MESALEITTGWELERFDLGTVEINRQSYTVLTGFEGTDRRCFWCGGELKGKLKRYCYGHMVLYYNHFNWGYASFEARKRAGYECENCGNMTNLEVHHIVPLKGSLRFFSPFNLPWNLIALCHYCHMVLHREMTYKPLRDIFEEAKRKGQQVFTLCE